MFIGTKFEYNGISSDDMNVILIHEEGTSSLKQVFSAQSEIISERVRYRNASFYYGKDYENMKVEIQITKNPDSGSMELSYEERVELMRWFCGDDQYHVFKTEDFPELEFMLIFPKSQMTNFFRDEGYITLTGESYLSSAMSSQSELEFDLSDNTGTTIIEFPNKSNFASSFIPNVMEFELVGNSTSFNLKNLSNGGNELSFTGLNTLETISISSDKQILSSTGLVRIDKCNFGFKALEMVYGINQLEITGRCIVRFKVQYPMQI